MRHSGWSDINNDKSSEGIFCLLNLILRCDSQVGFVISGQTKANHDVQGAQLF